MKGWRKGRLVRYELLTYMDGRAVIYDNVKQVTTAVPAPDEAAAVGYVAAKNATNMIILYRQAAALAGRMLFDSTLNGED